MWGRRSWVRPRRPLDGDPRPSIGDLVPRRHRDRLADGGVGSLASPSSSGAARKSFISGPTMSGPSPTPKPTNSHPAQVAGSRRDRRRPRGLVAAERAYCQLTIRGHTPRQLTRPAGVDPASRLHTEGAIVLRGNLDRPHDVATALIDAGPNYYIDRLDTVEGRVTAIRAAADHHRRPTPRPLDPTHPARRRTRPRRTRTHPPPSHRRRHRRAPGNVGGVAEHDVGRQKRSTRLDPGFRARPSWRR